jgi:hypothetical protein
MNDIETFFGLFHTYEDKISQDNFILKFAKVLPISRVRSKNENKRKREASIKYSIWRCIDGVKIPVCRETFIGILQISRSRVQGVMRRHRITGSVAVENRGGDHRSLQYADRKQAVITFVEQFKPVERHYCREKAITILYLPSSLSINKMWRIYMENAEESLKVKRSYFRTICNRNFNIEFGSPRTNDTNTK